MFRVVIAVFTSLALLAPSAALARTTDKPWPPATGKGLFFVHFGEEHINDADGGTLLPKTVEEAARYKPDLVTMSGDKAEDGEAEQFELWRKAMEPFDKAGVPYFAGTGNHDRDAPPGFPGGVVGLFFGTTPDSFDPYKEVFKDKPVPWGDAAPYADERITPRTRDANDVDGAAATYFVDMGNVRWIFLDNSCWSLSNCDPFQARSDGGSEPQFDYLRAKATEATNAGKVVFVVMHIPTDDPRDQSYTDATATRHVMGKGFTNDNTTFEAVAAETGVDGVFVGHIKGQFLYKGDGGVPYYIDGGAGGELYTTGPVGTDHGYWHGFRLLRVDGNAIRTDTVPIFVPDSLKIEGPDQIASGATAKFAGFGKQPVVNDPAKVDALELRDPDPKAPPGRQAFLAGLPDAGSLIPFVPAAFALLLAPMLTSRRRALKPVLGAGMAGVVLVGAVAVAQQDIPTATGKSALPTPARMWTSSDPLVLQPVAAPSDDDRRDARTQTAYGEFRGRCAGRATLTLTSGFEAQDRTITVPSKAGRLVRSTRRPKRVRRGAKALSVRVAQPVQVTITLRKGKRTVARASRACVSGTRSLKVPRKLARGRYTVELRVGSDRKPGVSRSSLRVI